VLNNPPNNRWPRLRSSCTLLFRRSALTFFEPSAEIPKGSGLDVSCFGGSTACGEERKVDGDSEVGSGEIRGRLDVSSEADDCRRFLRGLLGAGASDFGTTTADATGLRCVLVTGIVTECDELTQAYLACC
jgi:hypothetical protein